MTTTLRRKVTTPTLPGFEHINRYWDPRMNTVAAKILPGECYVSRQGEMIVTVLGSCIAACIRDKRVGVGGMNHFMLPIRNGSKSDSAITSELAYGNWAMEYLINEILKAGGTKNNLEIKLFGGGRVLENLKQADIGARNIEFVRSFLRKEHLSVEAEDLGSNCPRKVLYFPDTGAVKLKRMMTTANDTVSRREREYLDAIVKKPDSGDVELF